MTNTQLYIAIGVPMLFNAALIGLLVAYINARFDAVDQRFDAMEKRFNERFNAINQRFDDMRDLWRAELQRVEASWGNRIVQLEKTR